MSSSASSLALYALTSAINFTVLAPAGLTGRIFRSTAVAGLVVVVGASVLPHLFGAVGGAAVVAAAQAAALAVQVPAWRRVTAPPTAADGEPTVVPAARPSPLGGARPDKAVQVSRSCQSCLWWIGPKWPSRSIS